MVRKSDIDMLNRKIYSIRKVGKECFADVVEFNFLNNPIYMLMYLQPEMIKNPIFRFEPI